MRLRQNLGADAGLLLELEGDRGVLGLPVGRENARCHRHGGILVRARELHERALVAQRLQARADVSRDQRIERLNVLVSDRNNAQTPRALDVGSDVDQLVVGRQGRGGERERVPITRGVRASQRRRERGLDGSTSDRHRRLGRGQAGLRRDVSACALRGGVAERCGRAGRGRLHVEALIVRVPGDGARHECRVDDGSDGVHVARGGEIQPSKRRRGAVGRDRHRAGGDRVPARDVLISRRQCATMKNRRRSGLAPAPDVGDARARLLREVQRRRDVLGSSRAELVRDLIDRAVHAHALGGVDHIGRAHEKSGAERQVANRDGSDVDCDVDDAGDSQSFGGHVTFSVSKVC